MSDGRLGWMTVALALAIVPYAALMAFAHPVADDLAFAAAANVEGFWPALRIQYFSWNGRFASDVLALLDPIQTGTVLAYRLTLFALFLLTFAALYALVRVVTRPALTRREALACALGLGGVYVSQTPALGETFYWFTGAVVYQVACIAGALQIASFVEATRDAWSGCRRSVSASGGSRAGRWCSRRFCTCRLPSGSRPPKPGCRVLAIASALRWLRCPSPPFRCPSFRRTGRREF